MPSRPVSRAGSLREVSAKTGSEDSDVSQALGRFLGRKRKDATAAQHLSEFFPRTVTLGEPVVLGDYQGAHWLGMNIRGRTGAAWNGEIIWCFTLEANLSACVTTSLGPGQGCTTIHLPLDSQNLFTDELAKHCEGHTAVLRNHLLRLKSSTLEALYLGGPDRPARLSPKLPEDTAVLLRKSVYNDQLVSHPTFPHSVNSGTPILAMNDGGNLERFQLQDLLSPGGAKASHSSLDSRTTCFTPVVLQPTGQRLVITGDEDGWLKVWSTETNDLLGAECLFNCPVQVIEPSPFTEKGNVSELYVLSEDGTIAVYDLGQMALAFLIPGSRHAVEAVLSSGKDIVIAYSSGKTRVWDLDTLQFRRSTGVEAAEESLVNRTWLPLFHQSGNLENDLTKPERTTLYLKPNSLNLEDVGVLLHSLHTWNLQADIDNAIHSLIPSAKDARHSLRLLTKNTTINGDRASWQVSGRHTAWKQLLLVALAHRYIANPETEVAATQVITFYASILQDAVGPAFCTGDIAIYVEYYDHTDRKSHQESRTLAYTSMCTVHVHQAARLLLDAQIGAMADSDLLGLLDQEIGNCEWR